MRPEDGQRGHHQPASVLAHVPEEVALDREPGAFLGVFLGRFEPARDGAAEHVSTELDVVPGREPDGEEREIGRHLRGAKLAVPPGQAGQGGVMKSWRCPV